MYVPLRVHKIIFFIIIIILAERRITCRSQGSIREGPENI